MIYLLPKHKESLLKLVNEVAEHLQAQEGGYEEENKEKYSRLDAYDQIIQYITHRYDNEN